MENFVFPWIPIRRKFRPGHEFFSEGDVLCHVSQKQILRENPVESSENQEKFRLAAFVCHVMHCNKEFVSVSRYEAHYHSTHRNICSVCGRSLPSQMLLELHILETHDSMFQVMAAKSPMYECLVERCPERFLTGNQRHDHLITTHRYPPNFRFHRAAKKTKNKSKKKGAKLEDNQETSMEISCERSSQSTEEIHNTKIQPSKRQFSYKVPDKICFGQGVPRSFSRSHKPSNKKKGKHWHQKQPPGVTTAVNIEEVQMADLAEALK